MKEKMNETVVEWQKLKIKNQEESINGLLETIKEQAREYITLFETQENQINELKNTIERQEIMIDKMKCCGNCGIKSCKDSCKDRCHYNFCNDWIIDNG